MTDIDLRIYELYMSGVYFTDIAYELNIPVDEVLDGITRVWRRQTGIDKRV